MAAQKKFTGRLPRGERRKQLVTIAADEISHQRHLPVSYDQIAAVAQVTPALVYTYFPDQKDLCNAVLAEQLSGLHHMYSDQAQPIEEAAAAYFRFLVTHGTALTIILSDPAMNGRVCASARQNALGLLLRFARAVRLQTSCTKREALLAVLSFMAAPEELATNCRAGALEEQDAEIYVQQLAGLALRTLRKQNAAFA